MGINYSEGEYVHDMKHHLYDSDGNPSWHNRLLANRKGTTYPTHALGPVLDWFDERVATVSCFGSGRRSIPELINDDCNLLICQTPSGRLIKIRNDVLATGPVRKYYSLQGTKGVYEGNRRTVWAGDGNVRHTKITVKAKGSSTNSIRSGLPTCTEIRPAFTR